MVLVEGCIWGFKGVDDVLGFVGILNFMIFQLRREYRLIG